MLDKTGLTSSEASHVANFIKELVKSIDLTTSNFQVLTKKGTREGNILNLDDNKMIPNWPELLLEKGRLFSLSAWLKEAIKYKDAQIMKARNTQFDTEVIDPSKAPQSPKSPSLDFEDYFMELSIKDQAEYLSNESTAAHIGKFIHNFDTVRSTLDTFKPTEFVSLSPTEVMTVTNTLLYDKEELLQNFEKLQSIHRECEKKINFYRAKHKEWVADKQRTYQTELSKYRSEYAVWNSEYQSLIQKARSEFEIDKTNKLEALKNLRISIPKSLQPILDEVYEKLK